MIESSLQDIYPAKIFHDQMIVYLDEYTEYILTVKGDPNTITKRLMLQQFINYLFNEHLIKNIEEITPKMLHFGNLSVEEYPDLVPNTPQGQILATLSDFFEFIYGKHGLRNDTFSDWLKTELQ